MKQLEKHIQRDILKYLHYNKVYAWVNKTQGTYDPIRKVFRTSNMKKGVSDIIGLLDNGQFLAIEIKSKTGRLSPEQKEFLSEIQSHGGVSFMCRSLEECIEKIKPHILAHAWELV